jgi:hypothetical protein
MPRTVTTETTVYTYPELSDDAKETARARWSQFLWDTGSMQESMNEIWEHTLTEAGWSDLSDLTYALYSQGGYPAWSGTLAGFEHDGRTWTLRTDNRGSRYGRNVWIEDDESDPDGEYGSPNLAAYTARLEAAEEAARDHVRDLSHELYQAFEAEDEYQTSDEQMAETAEANGYEYDESGHLHY